MSRSYDDRIVRMGFENAKFESGAKQTISTLDKLNEKLKLKGATEGSENIQKSVDSVDFSSMERAILNIEKRFSTLGIVSMNVINKITNGIAGSVAHLEQMTIGQIKSGGWARAMNIANAKFQIEGLGFAWEEVEKAVSYGVKDTAYGLDAAASAASQLAASGVDFKKVLDTVNGQELTAMHKSLRAISGVAAMTNSSYEDIARIFTTVAGNGRLMGDQLLQLSSRGMNAAAKLAETLGKTEGEIREMVSRGQIDFQTFAFAMDNAFGDHAKEANKTFTGALGNMKAALSRVGEIFADPIINKTNTLFISLTTRIDEFKNKLKSIKVPRTLEEIKKQYGDVTLSATAYDEMLKGMGERTVTLGEDFAKMWQKGIDAFSKLVESVDLGWFDKVVEHVDKTVNKVSDFFDLIKEIYSDSAEEAANGIEDATKTLLVSAEEAQAAKDIILKGMYGSGQKRVDALTEMFGGGEIGAQHAKNVQAYVDSVVAAGWQFDKASIKVEDASDRIAKSQTDAAREVKKARIKSIIDNVKTTFSNLWTTTKNLGKAASKITTSILNAFSNVFKIDFGGITDGVSSFSGMLAKLSSKLIISDKTAERVTDIFTRFFEIVQKGLNLLEKGITLVGDFGKSVGESEAVTSLGDAIGNLFDKVLEFDAFKIGDDNPILKFLSSVLDAFDKLVTGDKNAPSKVTTFINDMLTAVKTINWKDVGNIAGSAFLIYEMINLVLSIRKLGGMITSIVDLPASITRFFNNMGTAVSNASNALVISAVAKSLAIVAGALVVLSQIPDQQLYKALGVVMIISLLIKYLIGAANSMFKGEAMNSLKEFASSMSKVFGAVKAIGAMSILFLALAGAATILSAGMAIIEKSGAAKPSVLFPLMILLASLAGVGIVIGEWMQSVNQKSITKMPIVFSSMAIMFVALGSAVLAMSGAMKILSTIPSESFGLIITLMGVIFVGSALMVKMATDAKAKELLTASVTIAAIGGAMSSIILSISAASMMLSQAASMLKGVDPGSYILLLTGVFSVFLTTIFLVNKAASVENFAKVAITLLSMSVAMTAVGGAALMIAAAIGIITNIGSENVDSALLVLGSILGGLVVIMYMTTALKPTQLLASAVMFIGLASAMLVLSTALTLLSNLGSKNMIEAAGAMVMTLVGIGIACTIAGAALSTAKNSTLSIIAGVMALSIAMVIISSAIAKLGDVKNLSESVSVLVGFLIAISIAIAALSIVGKLTEGSENTLLSVGAAFLMISASILVLAVAIEKMGEVMNNPNIASALITIGVFIGVVGALAIAAAFIPGATFAFEAVGKAFLYAGAGAALVGAGILLVCKGMKLLSPAVGILAISLEKLFVVIEEHKGPAIAVGVITLAIIAAIIVAIVKLGPVIEAIANTISAVAKRVGGTLDKGKSKLKNWVSNLSTKGKATIAALITTLCGAILKASPTVLNTVGQLLIKLLAYLGKIAGDLALGLVDFLINLINGLADAIRVNSARIAAALWGVVISLGDLLIQILGRLLTFLLNGIGLGSAADWITDKISKISEALNEYALEERRIAEEADKSKRDYNESIKNAANVTEEANKKSIASLDSLSNAFKKDFDDSGNQVDKFGEKYDTLMNKVWENDYSGAKMPALDKAGDNTNELMTRVWDSTGNVAPEQSLDEVLSENGWSTQDYAEAGEERSSACAESMFDGDEYYKASTENMEASQQAIIDSKEDTKKAIQTSFNEPAKAQIRASHQGMYDAARYSVEGAIKYIENEGTVKYRSAMVFLARAGQEDFIIANRISSPSKEYYEYAKYIVMGLVNGLTQNTDQASNAMGSLSDAILASFTDPIDYVSRIASGELVYDPSIRPVFDSSGLYKGASSINSMIRGQTVTVAGLSGRIAADIGTLDHSNADIISELQAMRADIASLGDEMADMQIVMDTGALVGATAPSMDRALGKRAIYKGRGN